MDAQVRPGRFKLAWFAAGIAVVPISSALTLAVILAASAMLEVFDDSWYMAIADHVKTIVAVSWLINGCCIGLLQKAIVTRYLRVDLGRWMVYSAFGALLASAIAYPCHESWCLPPQFYDDLIPPGLNATFESFRIVFLYLTVLSAVQILALSRIVSGSWRWIAAHSGSLVLALIASVAAQLLTGASSFDAALSVSLYVLLVTVATGSVMVRMLISRQVASEDVHHEWAYQPAPADTGAASERSIWDDAL